MRTWRAAHIDVIGVLDERCPYPEVILIQAFSAAFHDRHVLAVGGIPCMPIQPRFPFQSDILRMMNCSVCAMPIVQCASMISLVRALTTAVVNARTNEIILAHCTIGIAQTEQFIIRKMSL